jgi:hypothetical protein
MVRDIGVKISLADQGGVPRRWAFCSGSGAEAQYFSLKKQIYGILFRKEERSLWLVLVLFFLPELA